MLNCPITGKVCMKYRAFHVTTIKDNSLNVVNVCEDCLLQIDNIENSTTTEKEEKKEKKESSIVCEFCKLDLDELLKKSRLGCAKCYEVFEKPLIIAFEKLQRTPEIEKTELKHVGSVPSQWKKQQARETEPVKFLLELKQKLALNTKEEKYEKCKELKNAIIAFEFYIKKIDEFKNDQEQQSLIFDQMAEFIYNFREKELEK